MQGEGSREFPSTRTEWSTNGEVIGRLGQAGQGAAD